MPDMDDFFTSGRTLENERARLEPLTNAHLGLLWPIAVQKEIWEFTTAKIATEQEFELYFNQALSEQEQSLSIPFAIYDKKFERYAGSTRYGNISIPHKRLEVGWTWYEPALQRTGLNRSCKFLLLKHAFEVCNMNRVELKTSLTNLKSQAAIGKIGATKEGILRNHIINDDGTLRHSVIFSIIKEEWPEIRNTIFREY
ncbi:MAG: N-acetyltransferase [Chitinophagaceae bacterium]|nr:MAG: N-acetyltransferase [Chitinophagaceae bacterium]